MAVRKLEVIIGGDAKGALKAFTETSAGASGLGGKLASAGKVAAAGMAVGAAAVVGVGVALFKVGESFDESYDTIRVGTGKTGDALRGLEDDFKSVVQDVPTSFGDASMAIADLNKRTGDTGPVLQALAKEELELSRITKSDLGENIAASTRLFGDWNVATDDQAATLDKVFRASQATGIGVGSLMQSVVEFGAPLRGLGFGLDESLGLLSKWEKEGVNTGNVLGAMKKGFGVFSKEFGEHAPAEFRKFIAEIAKAPNASAAAALAIKKLGVRNGPDFAAAVKEGRFALGDLHKTISDGKETILGAAADTEDFGEKWTKLKNRVLVAIEPVASRVFDAVGKGMDALGPIATKMSSGVGAGFRAFSTTLNGGQVDAHGFAETAGVAFAQVVGVVREHWPEIQRVVREVMDTVRKVIDGVVGWVRIHWPEIQRVIKEVLDTVRTIIAGAVDLIMTIWNNFGDNVIEAIQRSWGPVQQIVRGALQIIRGIVQTVTALIHGDWSQAWEGVKAIVAGAWNVILGSVKLALERLRFIVGIALEILGSMFKGAWNAIGNGMRAAWGAILDFFKTLPGKIVGATGDLGRSLFHAGWELIAGFWDGIKASWNHLADMTKFELPKIHIWGTDKDIGGGSVSLLPHLAKGGVAADPMLAVVGDAGFGDPEIVTPESLMRSIVADTLRDHESSFVTGDGGITINYNVNVNASGLSARELEAATLAALRSHDAEIVRLVHQYRRRNARLPWEKAA